jgi:hypothetical protein
MINRTSEARRARVLVGSRGNNSLIYEAVVEVDRQWAHLRDVTERVAGCRQRRCDRSIAVREIREIRWASERGES